MIIYLNESILHNIISPYKTLLFNELGKLCNELTVLYLAEKESNRDWNINVNEMKFSHEVVSPGSLDDANSAVIAMKTWKRLNALDPDILIIGGYNYPAYWAGFYWAKRKGKKIILWSASNEEDRDRNRYKEKLKSFVVRSCDAANVYGEKNRQYLLTLGVREDKIITMGNTTDNAFFNSETMKLKTERKELCSSLNVRSHNFIYIGRFSPEKNVLQLLKAYNKLKNGDSPWGLILVGSGPQKKEYEAFIEKNNVKNVFMPGFKQIEEIPRFLAVSDVLVLPSISEPWGLVVNEAMAAGLPVLVSRRCGCYPDLVKDGANGYSFDPVSDNELYHRMQDIVDGRYDLAEMGKVSLDVIRSYTPAKAAETIMRTIAFVLK